MKITASREALINTINGYKNIDSPDKDFNWLKDSIKKYKKYEGNLLSSAGNLKECLLFDDQVGIKFGRVFLYSFLLKDLNLSDTKAQALYQRTLVSGLYLITLAYF